MASLICVVALDSSPRRVRMGSLMRKSSPHRVHIESTLGSHWVYVIRPSITNRTIFCEPTSIAQCHFQIPRSLFGSRLCCSRFARPSRKGKGSQSNMLNKNVGFHHHSRKKKHNKHDNAKPTRANIDQTMVLMSPAGPRTGQGHRMKLPFWSQIH